MDRCRKDGVSNDGRHPLEFRRNQDAHHVDHILNIPERDVAIESKCLGIQL